MRDFVRNWPALCIALIVAFYWSRVLRLVYKSYRATGRGANFWPAEPLGRALRFLWIPAVVCWIGFPLAVALGAHSQPFRAFWTSPPLASFAAAIALLALILTMICWKKMGRSWRMGIDPAETTQLIVHGPYAFVRHPIYALSQLLMLASFIAVPNVAMMIVALIHIAFLQWEARREERYLVATHGAGYANYLARVGRFVPKSIVAYR